MIRSLSLIPVLVLAASCGGNKKSSAVVAPSAVFPNFETIGNAVVPKVGATSFHSLSSDRIGTSKAIKAVTYSGTSSDLTSEMDRIADVLGNNLTGVNTQIAVQLNQLQQQVDYINEALTNSVGMPANCTLEVEEVALNTNDGSVKVPFFTNSGPIFWGNSDHVAIEPTVTCFVKESYPDEKMETGMLFGKKSLTTVPEGCTDPYVYWITNGNSQIEAANSSDVANRGSVVSKYQTQALYYNGCTRDVGIAMALTTLYPQATGNGVNDEFNARFELFGNASTSTFQLRTIKFDGYNGGTPSFHSIRAAGKAQGTGNLILEFTPYTCNNDTCASPSAGTTHTYCLALGGTVGSVSVDSNTANCSTYETDFEDANLTRFTDGSSPNLSRSVIDFTDASVFGL